MKKTVAVQSFKALICSLTGETTQMDHLSENNVEREDLKEKV